MTTLRNVKKRSTPPPHPEVAGGQGKIFAQQDTQKDFEAHKRIAAAYGRRGKGKRKTMSKAAVAQRRAAGLSSAIKRGFVDEAKLLRIISKHESAG